MRKTSLFVITGLSIATLLVTGYTVGVAAPLVKARPTVTAVVDLQKAVDLLEQRKALEADFTARTERLNNEARDKRKTIEDLQRDLKELAVEGTNEFNKKRDELTRKLVEFEVWNRVESSSLNSERNIQSEKLYKDVVDAIGQLAKENGYDVVLTKQVNLNVPTGRAEQPNVSVPIRGVIWVADELDITSQLVTKMNNEFKNMINAGNKPALPTPAPATPK